MRLYTKFMVWSVLNLVWVAVVVVGGSWLLLGSNGLFAHVLFRGGINSVMHVVAANLQYKPIYAWQEVLQGYSESYEIRFHVQSLDDMGNIPSNDSIPDKVIKAANRIPRPQISLCPEPDESGTQSIDSALETESGFLPMQNAIYLRAGNPTRYWYGRLVFIPDENHKLHYVLLVSSSLSFSGHGLYFNMYGVLITIALVLGLSFLWWWPFVLRITRPVARITRDAEQIAAGHYVLPEHPPAARVLPLSRQDEIKRLDDAVDSMSSQLMHQMFGQRRFIRQIAHELGSPIARMKFGLAVLEERVDEETSVRVRKLSKDMEEVAMLVEDVLDYLRSEGVPGKPTLEPVPLVRVVKELIDLEGQHADIVMEQPECEVVIQTDLECLRRAVGNVLRNAVCYAGDSGPITVHITQDDNEVVVRVEDNGPGVPPNELPNLTEPFFRGERASEISGGSGLGLSIVKQCMKICHGRLQFSNRSPQGLSVFLIYPRVHKDPPSA